MVEVETESGSWQEVSLTPEIYHLLSAQDQRELDDPRTRRKILSKLESDAFFEHEDLEQLELFLVREDRKREQEKQLEGANIKNAVIQRFLARRTTREEEEDERIRQQEIQDVIEEAEDNEEDSETEEEARQRVEQFLIRMAALAYLERRVEEMRQAQGEGAPSTVQEPRSSSNADSSDTGSSSEEETETDRQTGSDSTEQLERGSLTQGQGARGSGDSGRRRTENEAEVISNQPKRDSKRKQKQKNDKKDRKDKVDSDEKEKKGCLDSLWNCLVGCMCCCL